MGTEVIDCHQQEWICSTQGHALPGDTTGHSDHRHQIGQGLRSDAERRSTAGHDSKEGHPGLHGPDCVVVGQRLRLAGSQPSSEVVAIHHRNTASGVPHDHSLSTDADLSVTDRPITAVPQIQDQFPGPLSSRGCSARHRSSPTRASVAVDMLLAGERRLEEASARPRLSPDIATFLWRPSRPCEIRAQHGRPGDCGCSPHRRKAGLGRTCRGGRDRGPTNSPSENLLRPRALVSNESSVAESLLQDSI